MKLGLSSFAYRWSIGVKGYIPSNPMNLDQFINKAISLNLSGVQICDNLRYYDLSECKLKKIKKRIEERRMFIETGAMNSNPMYLKTMLMVSNKLGSTILRVIPEINRYGSKKYIQDQLNSIIKDIEKVLDVAKDSNVRLALENHANLSSEELLYIIKSIDDNFIGVCLDTMNSIVLMEHPLKTAQVLAPYSITVHLKDFRIEKNSRGHKIIGVPLGEGLVDFPKIIKILKQSNLDPNINLELFVDKLENEEETLQWEDDCVAKSVNYARKKLMI